MRGSITRRNARAIVTNNEDPEKIGRIRVRCGELGGNNEEIAFWATPHFPYAGPDVGMFFIPPVGAAVEIDWIAGSNTDVAWGQATMFNPDIRYTASLYKDESDVPSEFQTDYGKRFGIKAGANLLLMFDQKKKEVSLVGDTVLLGGTDKSAQQPVIAGDDYVAGRQNALDDLATAMGSLSTFLNDLNTAITTAVDGDTFVALLKAAPVNISLPVAIVDTDAADTTCSSESADTPNHLSEIVKVKK